jgi:TonB-dependent receptor
MKFTIRILIISLLLMIPQYLWAQSDISGTIRDKKTGETIVGAAVRIDGTSTGVLSDLNGNFKLSNLKYGSYTLVVTYISYKKQSIPNVKVEQGKTITLTIDMEEEITSISGVTIKATRSTDSEISMMSSIRNSDLLTTGISSQQITKTQDRDASEVIRRASGITIIENRFVIVRGLNERYNTVWLNNANAPSTETDVKAFSFDGIPSSLIDHMMIYKSPAPELPGDFAGASIQVFTKNTVDKNYITFGYSSSYRDGTGFKNFYTSSDKSSTDWLGYGASSRELPSGFPDDIVGLQTTADGKKQLVELSKTLNNDWKHYETKANTDHRFNLGFGGKIKAGKSILSNITSLNYSYAKASSDIYRAWYLQYDTIHDAPDTSWYYKDAQYTTTVKTGALCNFSWSFGKDQKLEFRSFYNHIGQQRTTLREGYDYDNLATDIKADQYSYMERTIYSTQVGGVHPLNENMKLDWTFGYAYANRNEPDTRRITSVLYKEDPDFPYYMQYQTLLSNFPDPRLAGRLYSINKEEIYNLCINYEYKIKIGKFTPTLKVGGYYEQKNRNFSSRLLGYVTAPGASWKLMFMPVDSIFSEQHINAVNGVYIQEKTNPSDSYEASRTLYAGYIAFNIPITKKMNLYTGLRIENNRQALNSFSSDYSLRPVNVDVQKTDFFPSANLVYNFSEKMLLRAAYGITINRPEFREIAPYAFYDFEMGATVIGNDTLKDSRIHNFDLRYEFYPSMGETFSVGLFYKNFINPIESIIIPAGSDINYSFANAKSASNYGAEIEIRKDLSSFCKSKSFFWLKDISILLNASYIFSNVKFDEVQSLSIKEKRPMQGQSPYIINCGLQYQNDSIGLQVNVMYNIIGKRIIYVGDKNTPDIYEMPHHLLDISFSQRICKFLSLKGGVQDVLNQSYVFKQYETFLEDNNGTSKEVTRSQNTMSFKRGAYYTLGLSFRF